MPDLPPKADRDQALKTPPAERTEAYGSSGQTIANLQALDLGLRSLQQRYDLLEELGQGGMGIVYRARDRETEEYVALKILRPEVAERADIIERFKAELRLARKITHKNVCRTYELLRFDSTVAIAMEYVEGQSLRKVLEGVGGVSLRRGLDWASQICDALREAHAQGVVHRDLKPENIVVGPRGDVKVMDFGIARSLDKDATHTGTVIGTPAYMAPEQAEGKPIDQRADIYSLGLILYEMFTGRHAFQGDSGFALAFKQIHETPPPPHEVEPALPANIAGAIVKATEKAPNQRFNSVQELKEALTTKTERVVAAPADESIFAAEAVNPWLKNPKVALGVAGGALLALLLANQYLPPENTLVSFLAVSNAGMVLVNWPRLKRLNRLLWCVAGSCLVGWVLALLISWKAYPLIIGLVESGRSSLPKFALQMLMFSRVMTVYYLILPFVVYLPLLLPGKPTDVTKVRPRWLKSMIARLPGHGSDLALLNTVPVGAALLVLNTAFIVLVFYSCLILPMSAIVKR